MVLLYKHNLNKVKHTFEFDIPKQEALGCVCTYRVMTNSPTFPEGPTKKIALSGQLTALRRKIRTNEIKIQHTYAPLF